MGAINYFTSDYITLGVKPYEVEDFLNDPDFTNYLKNETCVNIEDEEEVTSFIYSMIRDYYDDDYANVQNELENHIFIYFNVVLKPGYYEGFSIDIEHNFGVCYDDYTEKQEAQKEITEIKEFLMNCAGYGMVECFPGWCTGYSNYKETVKAIRAAIAAMRDEVRNTPTYNQLKAAGELW